MLARGTIAAVVCSWIALSSALGRDDAKLADQTFVGNWMVAFNPAKGGGTQQLTVDVNETGSYIATDMYGERDPVRGRFEAKDGKFILRAADGTVIDQGTYEPFGPQIQLTGSAGKGFWNKVSGESKQAALKNLPDDLKAMTFEPVAAAAIKSARAKWQKDAVLVEAKIVPNDNGTFDLTVSGGNGVLKFFSPAARAGCVGIVDSLGGINLYPEDKPVALSTFAIPSNVIDLKTAMSTATSNGNAGAVKEASLYGVGEDADLRQFCWVFVTQDSVVAVDALVGDITDYREFMDGRERASKVPFMQNKGTTNFYTSFDGTGAPEMMWAIKHPVFLDGMDEAIIILVPWRVVPEEELLKHAQRTDSGGINYRAESSLYPLGDPAPPAGDVLARFMQDKNSIPIACAPFAVRTEKPLADYPAGTKQRIIKQLESYWRANGGK